MSGRKGPSISIDSDSALNDIEQAPQDTPGKIEIGPDGLPVSIIPPGDAESPTTVAEGTEHVEHFEEVEEEETTESQKVTIPTVGTFPMIMSLLNSLLGAGILSVPNSFTSEGIVPSLIILLLMWGLSYLATVMVITLKADTGATGLPDLALKILGKPGEIGLAIMSLLFLVAAQLSYLVLGGDMLTSWFALGGIDVTILWRRAIMMFVYGVCFPGALTVPRNNRFLSYFGTVTVVSILFFDISMVIKGVMKFTKDGPAPVIISRVDINMFSALSIYGLAFALPVVCLPPLALYNPDTKARSRVSLYAMILCLILVLIPGLFGYLQFGAETKPNIMQNYPDDDKLILVVRIAFFLVVSFAYPAVGQSTMVSWGNLVFKDGLVKQMPWKKRIVVLLLTNAIPLLVAMFLANAKPALSIGGAMGGCVADFVFPSLMWIFHYKEHKWYHPKKIPLWLFAIFGAVAAAISTYTAVVDAIKAFS